MKLVTKDILKTLITSRVHGDRPAFVRFCRREHRQSWPRLLVVPLGADRKPFLCVDPMGATSRGGCWC